MTTLWSHVCKHIACNKNCRFQENVNCKKPTTATSLDSCLFIIAFFYLFLQLTINALVKTNKNSRKAGGGGGRCLQGNLWYSPPASMTSRLASVTFKMANKVFIEETDKNFDFITEIPFRFLGFGDFKVSIVIEN